LWIGGASLHLGKIEMSNAVKPKRRWFLKAQLTVLLCVFCIWIAMLVTTDIDSTKAAFLRQAVKIWPDIGPDSNEAPDETVENTADFNEPLPVFLPIKEKFKDYLNKLESRKFGLVTGICYSTDKPSAVINDKIIVYEGDTINGVTIVKIYKDKVEFAKNGKSWTLKVTRLP
jgi:hypothetical protein